MRIEGIEGLDPLKQLIFRKEIETQEEIKAMLNPKKVSKVETLPEEILDHVMDWAQTEGVDKVRAKVRKKGFIVGRSTLARYLRERKKAEAAEARAALAATANELASGKDGTAWRTGALEALRGKIFDVALGGGANVEERLRLYQALVTEEERLKKLALAEERARMQREGLELQRQRLQIEAARGGARLFLEALRILGDDALATEAKVERARAALEQWREDGIGVEQKAIGNGKMNNGNLRLEEGAEGTANDKVQRPNDKEMTKSQ